MNRAERLQAQVDLLASLLGVLLHRLPADTVNEIHRAVAEDLLLHRHGASEDEDVAHAGILWRVLAAGEPLKQPELRPSGFSGPL